MSRVPTSSGIDRKAGSDGTGLLRLSRRVGTFDDREQWRLDRKWS